MWMIESGINLHDAAFYIHSQTGYFCRLHEWRESFCWFVCLGQEDWEIETNMSLDFQYKDPKLLSFYLHEEKNHGKTREADTCSWHICTSVQFSSLTQSCPTLCDPMNRSAPGLPVHHHFPEFTQTHVHRVRDAIQPSHPRSSPSPPSQHQSLFQWVSSSHEVAKVLEFQL